MQEQFPQTLAVYLFQGHEGVVSKFVDFNHFGDRGVVELRLDGCTAQKLVPDAAVSAVFFFEFPQDQLAPVMGVGDADMGIAAPINLPNNRIAVNVHMTNNL